jgi:hypothetical protein
VAIKPKKPLPRGQWAILADAPASMYTQRWLRMFMSYVRRARVEMRDVATNQEIKEKPQWARVAGFGVG